MTNVVYYSYASQFDSSTLGRHKEKNNYYKTIFTSHMAYGPLIGKRKRVGPVGVFDIVISWCSKYRIETNLLKTEIMHFHNHSHSRIKSNV